MTKFKDFISRLPLIGTLAGKLYANYLKTRFKGSQSYWIERYSVGGNSGAGSYDKFAEFKADIINKFVLDNDIHSVIEFGCGDGNQLKLANYDKYLGLDISPVAVAQCKHIFNEDPSKNFKLTSEFSEEKADLALSLDVIYHLVEDNAFETYMKQLFLSAHRYVILYSSNTDEQEKVQSPHVRHRHFTDWINKHIDDWSLLQHIPNKFPYRKNSNDGSFANFYIYGKAASIND